MYGADGKYGVGNFENFEFKAIESAGYLDYGDCVYAGQTFNNYDDPYIRKHLAWMVDKEWPWGCKQEEGPFNGVGFSQSMSLMCDLSLHKTNKGYRLFRTPIDNVETLRDNGEEIQFESEIHLPVDVYKRQEIYRPELIERDLPYSPTRILIALGTNDLVLVKEYERIKENIQGFYQDFISRFQGVPTTVLTPIWQTDLDGSQLEPLFMPVSYTHLSRLVIKNTSFLAMISEGRRKKIVFRYSKYSRFLSSGSRIFFAFIRVFFVFGSMVFLLFLLKKRMLHEIAQIFPFLLLRLLL